VGAEWTAWVIIAADFYYSTGVRLSNPNEEMTNKTLEQIARFFTSASRCMWKLMGAKEPLQNNNWTGLRNLHFAGVSAVKGRLKVKNPEMVNRLLHKTAIECVKMGATSRTGTRLNFLLDWPEIGKLLWKEQREELGFLQRMRGKQKPPKGRDRAGNDKRKKQSIETDRGGCGNPG
jgi:hypothetical protein